MSVENYKNVIIGSGEGGKYLAWHFGTIRRTHRGYRAAVGRRLMPEPH